MALTPVGFGGQVDENGFAAITRHLGEALPTADSRGALFASVNTGAALTMSVAAGTVAAHGVTVVNSAVASVVLDAVATPGHTRWDAVVLRYDWSGTGGTVTLTKVNGTSAVGAPMVRPAVLNSTPGGIYDQVLCLVQVTYGSTLPGTPVDCRLWASKVYSADSLAGLPSPSSALYGTEVAVKNVGRYRCVQDASSSYVWLPDGGLVAEFLSSAVIVPATGWSVASPLYNRGLKSGLSVTLDLEIRRTGATIAASSSGDFGNTLMGTIASNLTPDRTRPVFGHYYGGTTFQQLPFSGALGANGQLFIYSGAPGWDLRPRTVASDISIRTSITFTRKVA